MSLFYINTYTSTVSALH